MITTFIVLGSTLLYLFIGLGIVKLIDTHSTLMRLGKDYGKDHEGEIDYGIALISTVFWPFTILVMIVGALGKLILFMGQGWMILLDKILGDK